MDALLWELLEEGTPGDWVRVLIKTTDLEKLPVAEIKEVARIGSIVSCKIRRSEIIPVRDREEIVSMKAQRSLYLDPPLNENLNGAHSNASEVSEKRIECTIPYTGKGIVVGIADWGFDFTHPNFINEDGTTRFKWIWDQGTQYDGNNKYGYGAIHSSVAINNALRSETPFIELKYHPGKADLFGNGMRYTSWMRASGVNRW